MKKDVWSSVDTGLVAMNLYSSSGKVWQLSVGLVEPDFWSLGLNDPELTGQEEPGCTRTYHDHADVPQTENLLCNTCILALIVTLKFIGINFNNMMYFH
jgi:hypothetical protein